MDNSIEIEQGIELFTVILKGGPMMILLLI